MKVGWCKRHERDARGSCVAVSGRHLREQTRTRRLGHASLQQALDLVELLSRERLWRQVIEQRQLMGNLVLDCLRNLVEGGRRWLGGWQLRGCGRRGAENGLEPKRGPVYCSFRVCLR